RVVVAGDAMLDEFVYGEIARVSREAPVLILHHRRTEIAPGGAGNTAANLAALGVRTTLVGRIGRDEQGARLRDALAALGVDTAGLIEDPRYQTPTKTRILAGSPHTAKQQIVRLDRGDRPCAPRAAVVRRMTERVARAARRGAAVILADYGYGGLAPDWPARLDGRRGPLVVDSRFRVERFRGVDAATPNLEELERACGLRLDDDDTAAIERAGRALARRLGAEALLVTRGSRGMTLLERRRAPAAIPVFGSDEVADVTGAGDTVIAVFTAARVAGASWREAAELANVAGGLVVMKRGTATTSREELAAAIEDGWDAG
ncbi:MAG: sugar kinase, partial [Acidobacteria bacterium]